VFSLEEELFLLLLDDFFGPVHEVTTVNNTMKSKISLILRKKHSDLEKDCFAHAAGTALGLTRPPIQWVPESLSLGVKRLGREADHSPPSSAEVKERVELYLRFPNTPSWRGAQLRHRDNFTFAFTFCQSDHLHLLV
jgi:hypothetical protein